MFAEIHFGQPAWLWALPFLLGVFFLLAGLRPGLVDTFAAPWRSVARRIYRHPVLERHTSGEVVVTDSGWYALMVRWLAWPVLLALLFVALSQPERRGARIPDPPSYRDIVFVVDTSVSLVLKDYRLGGQMVSRERMLKDVLTRFVTGLEGNRIGLVTFSEHAYTYVPLTPDHATLLYQLRRIRPARLTGRTSHLGEALLYLAREYAPERPGQDGAPVFILISDVNRPDRDVDPRVAAAWLAQQGLVLHTVALGAGKQDAVASDAGGLVYQPMNYRLLEEIATAARGRFFWARDRKALDDALAVIRETARHARVPLPEYVSVPLYRWPLGMAMAWILAWQAAPLLRSRLRRRRPA